MIKIKREISRVCRKTMSNRLDLNLIAHLCLGKYVVKLGSPCGLGLSACCNIGVVGLIKLLFKIRSKTYQKKKNYCSKFEFVDLGLRHGDFFILFFLLIEEFRFFFFFFFFNVAFIYLWK
jgi:hypothetical protein